MQRVLIFNVTHPAWDEWIRNGPHDVYHTAAYHRFSQEQGEGTAFLAVCGSPDRFLAWPYLLRRIETQATCFHLLNDITSVYGYTGPVAHGCEPGDAFVKGAVAAIQDAWRSQNAISAFVRFHPLLESQRWLADAAGSDSIGGGGRTVSVDTCISDEETYRTYTRILRQEIAAARRAGLRTEVDESWSTVQEFLRLYQRTMIRNGASARYDFSAEYILDLKKKLGPHAVLLNTTLGGRIVLACIWIAYGKWMHAHLEGADENYLRYSPFKVMIDDVRRWARDRGYKALHLGGGRGGKEDSLFAFKARFSRLHHSFWTGRFVLDRPVYNSLCEARRNQAAESGMLFEPNDFFPAYRAPLVEGRCEPSHLVREQLPTAVHRLP